ncbi:hypothetical protein [Streptomyces sp. AK02-01A]|uniref:hypothetical protein n=1 Tax=Streptomyces sp. AK02-01A TaxID=3028648 RepID=UPI0029BF700B|nr:hypothetical protein [Streptomyces sp. AK02-01A]MDX3853736.1 hypothetical protein [Streptomyces sp. AK02-01A]
MAGFAEVTGGDRQEARMYEITYLDAGSESVTYVGDAREVRDVLERAGRHGVKVRVRPYVRPDGGYESAGAGRAEPQP